MSVLIRGMEMPKSCRDCDFMNWGAVEPNRCGITDCFIGGDYDKRHDNCPLVPAPPHGRLIDADAIERHTETEWFCGRKRVKVPWEAVSDAPTIIPAEEGET